jgi:spermidine synthase
LGAYIFGRWRGDAYKTYALIEIGIGLFAIVSFYLISPVATLLAEMLHTTPDAVEGLRPIVVIGSVLLLLPPCTLIGGTLPLMFRCFIGPANFSTRMIGLVYGVNTLGASIGIVAVPVVLLNNLSLPVTLMIVGSVNISLGVLIFMLGRGVEKPDPARPVPSAERPVAELTPLIFALAFVSGFVAIGFEVSLFRAIQIVRPSSTYNFPAVLAPFLLALALGSIVFTRGISEDRDVILSRIAWLLTMSAAAMFIGIWVFSHLRASGYRVPSKTFIFGGVLVMPVPLLTGAIFPLLLRLRSSAGSDLASATGKIYLVNSVGAFSGAMLGKFLGFPFLGTQGFLTLVYGLSSGCGLGVWTWVCWRRAGEQRKAATALLGGMLAVSIAIAAFMPSGAWRTYITGGPEQNWEVREGVTGVAQIRWEQDFGDVHVNGQYMSKLPHHPRHVKQSAFLLAQPRRERVLVLGIGGAGIIRLLVEDERVTHIDVVDWSYELPGLLSSGRASTMLNHALASPKVRIVRTDARVAVGVFEKESVDLIFDNLAYPDWAGATSIKSETYFKKIRRILKPDGVFVKSTNYAGKNRLGVLAGLIRTFELVEEHEQGEVVVSSRTRPSYSDARIREVLTRSAAYVNAGSPDVDWFTRGFVTITEAQLRGARPIRDDLLIHEYHRNLFRR